MKILFASRLVYEKGVDILIDCIESFASDRELQDQIEWHICSDGDAREDIVKLSKKYKDINYYGRVSQERIQELYKQVDILFMPSRFLETFGLTALEALTCGTPVCAPTKGGLRPFVTPELALNESSPVESFHSILIKKLNGGSWSLPDIGSFSEKNWNDTLSGLFDGKSNILIVHDYEEKIGGAEYYIELVRRSLGDTGKNVYFYGYKGHTTVWKRRIMFILSIFAFWRGIALYRLLENNNIDNIWMHSVLRYIGPWGVLAVRLYQKKKKVYLSHHDIGLLAAFPQDITSESSIPMSSSLYDFIPEAGILKKIISIGKYVYVRIIAMLIPRESTHIIFSPFLENNIRGQFGEHTKIEIFPHKTISQTSSSIRE